MFFRPKPNPKAEVLLEFENVSKSFWAGTHRKVILDRASFQVSRGKSMGILAPNGTGKTTLVNMMCGTEKPDEGGVWRNCRVSAPLGFMAGLVGKHTANENARYIAKIYDLDPDYVEAYCRWLCDIGSYFDLPIGTYSSGMSQRFGFSLTLALEYDIYLIDEGMPSTTDPEFNRRAGNVLFDRLKNSTAVIVSHQPATIEKFCNSAAILRDGQLYQFDTLEEAKFYYDYSS